MVSWMRSCPEGPAKCRWRDRDSMGCRVGFDANFCTVPWIDAHLVITPPLFSESSVLLRPTYLATCWQKTFLLWALINSMEGWGLELSWFLYDIHQGAGDVFQYNKRTIIFCAVDFVDTHTWQGGRPSVVFHHFSPLAIVIEYQLIDVFSWLEPQHRMQTLKSEASIRWVFQMSLVGWISRWISRDSTVWWINFLWGRVQEKLWTVLMPIILSRLCDVTSLPLYMIWSNSRYFFVLSSCMWSSIHPTWTFHAFKSGVQCPSPYSNAKIGRGIIIFWMHFLPSLRRRSQVQFPSADPSEVSGCSVPLYGKRLIETVWRRCEVPTTRIFRSH